jgi:3-dehydroquinate synthase II
MKKILFRAVPFFKEEVTLALESGVDGLLVPEENKDAASALARCLVLKEGEVEELALASHEEESRAAAMLDGGRTVVLRRGWEIIPVENLLAHAHAAESPGALALEVAGVEEAALAAGILEKGVDTLLVVREGLADIKAIVAQARSPSPPLSLAEAVITQILPAGMGHRVCVDTLSLFTAGQGMLTGNSAAFTFLVNAETERNEYVASRPFRINAGAVHAYALMPGDRTTYLEELRAGAEVLIADHAGNASTAVVGRVKVERRPMLLVRARAGEVEGAVFLQNAETIRLVRPGGKPVSVVALAPGDTILCRLDEAGRHFGMRIKETITEE